MPEMPVLSPPWIALIGVIIGFLLGEGSRYLRYWIQVRRNKMLIRTELQSILKQLPQKSEILILAIEAMEKQQVLATNSVRAITIGYYAVREGVYLHLESTERNCLHVIYERLRIADEQMEELENFMIQSVKNGIPPNPSGAYIDRCEDLLRSYEVVSDLVGSYLSGRRVNVFE